MPHLNIPLVASIVGMFSGCTSLKSVRDINAPKATSIGTLFNGCTSLVNAPSITAPLCTAASRMFAGCSSLKTVGELYLPAATDISYCFHQCVALEEAPKIGAPVCTNAQYLFAECERLKKVTELNLPKAGMSYAFTACDALRTVKMVCAGVGTTSSYNTFNTCYNLVDLEIEFHGGGGYVGPFYRAMRRCILTSGSGTAPSGWPARMDFCDTGISRPEAVELFQKIPTTTRTSARLNFSTTPAAADLTDEDIAIVVAKGWAVST